MVNIMSFLLNLISQTINLIRNLKFRCPRTYLFIQFFIYCSFSLVLIHFLMPSKYKIIAAILIIIILLLFCGGTFYLIFHHYVETLTIDNTKYAIVGCDSHGLKLVAFDDYTDTSNIEANNFSFNEYKPYKCISYEQAYNIHNEFKKEVIQKKYRKKH